MLFASPTKRAASPSSSAETTPTCSTQLVLVSPQQDEAVEIAAVHLDDRDLDVLHFAALLEAREVGHGAYDHDEVWPTSRPTLLVTAAITAHPVHQLRGAKTRGPKPSRAACDRRRGTGWFGVPRPVMRDLMGGRATVVQSKTQAERSAFVNAFLSEVTTASTRDREGIPDRRAAT